MTFDFDVFLSYQRDDEAVVRTLAERLRAAGLRVWWDQWRIPAGDDVWRAIEEGLEQSRVCVACMSPGYFDSQWTRLERNTALFRDPDNQQRRFVPLMLADCQIPDVVRRLKYIDYRSPGADRLQELIDACREQEAKPAERPPIESRALSLGHTNWVSSVAFTPDGRRVVTGCWDKVIRVWDLSSGRCEATLEGHSDYVRSVSVSPDGTRAVSGSSDQTVRVWDLSSGRCEATLEGHSGSVLSVSVSPDGTRPREAA